MNEEIDDKELETLFPEELSIPDLEKEPIVFQKDLPEEEGCYFIYLAGKISTCWQTKDNHLTILDIPLLDYFSIGNRENLLKSLSKEHKILYSSKPILTKAYVEGQGLLHPKTEESIKEALESDKPLSPELEGIKFHISQSTTSIPIDTLYEQHLATLKEIITPKLKELYNPFTFNIEE